jgi:hypothetical protein
MIRRHIGCGRAVGYRVVMADDGEPALVRWCVGCGVAPGPDEVDPPGVITVDEVPFDDMLRLLGGESVQ